MKKFGDPGYRPKFHYLYVIGLTGNIGCGKSTVVQMMAERGAQVCDADQVTRQVMVPGEAAYQGIVATFGREILATDGTIDRPALGRIVFSDPARLKQLESIVHPATKTAIMKWLNDLDKQGMTMGGRLLAIVDAIKLLENGWPAVCDQVWVVRCDPEVQLRRLVEQRGMSEADARQRIAAQPPQEDKVAVADVVIDNSGTIEATRQQIESFWPVR